MKELTIEYVYMKIQPKCSDCGKRLGRKSIADWAEMCGLEDLIEEGALCIRCGQRGVREIQENLSFARFGEHDRYDEVDFDDFPGFRD